MEAAPKKKVALVADVKGWAWHRRAQGIRDYAPPEYECEIHFEESFPYDQSDEYDAILWMGWMSCPIADRANVWSMVANGGLMYKHEPDSDNFHQRCASRGKNIDSAQKLLPLFKGVICINPRALSFCKDLNPNTVYLDTGVDTRVFRDKTHDVGGKHKLRVGWCGKYLEDAWTPKGFDEVLTPLKPAVGNAKRIEWKINTNIYSNALSRDQMVEWYNSIDLLLVTSCSEGTPSVLLEALACGRPFLSTDVGLALAAATTGAGHRTGTVVPGYQDRAGAEEAVENLAIYLRQFAKNPSLMAFMSKPARDLAAARFSWSKLSVKWLEVICA